MLPKKTNSFDTFDGAVTLNPQRFNMLKGAAACVGIVDSETLN
jgi:hypothetical protein